MRRATGCPLAFIVERETDSGKGNRIPGGAVGTLQMKRALSAPGMSHRRMSAFPGTQIAVLFFVLMLLTSVPIWTHVVPPLSDYVNHLARMHIIANLATDATLGQYYDVEWQIIPNLMMDVVVPPLARLIGIYRAGQAFTVAAFVLIISGTLALSRSLFGRWTAVPLIAMPFLYNYVFLVGVMNYIFGIGLALWALAAWIWLRDFPWPWRTLVATIFVVGLFFCHLFTVGLFGVGLLAYELWRLILVPGKRAPLDYAAFAASGLPFLPVLPLLAASPTMGLARDVSWEPRGKIDGLMYIVEVYSDIVAFLLIATIAAAAVWAARKRLLRFHPLGWMLLAVGGVVYLALPRIMFATYMADQRLPIALMFMLLGCIDLSLQHRLVRRGFVAILLTLVILRVTEVNVSWASLSGTMSEFRSSVKRLKPGAKVLVAYGTSTGGDDVSDLGLVHAACLAIIERSALVTTAFTVVGKQILRVRPAYAGMVDSQDGTPPTIEKLVLAGNASASDDDEEVYWQMWPSRYDYLYVLFTDDDADNPAPKYLTMVQNGTRFQLYRINRPLASNVGPLVR
jgi:hypothetical protein